jgi:hypothetical protein
MNLKGFCHKNMSPKAVYGSDHSFEFWRFDMW